MRMVIIPMIGRWNDWEDECYEIDAYDFQRMVFPKTFGKILAEEKLDDLERELEFARDGY